MKRWDDGHFNEHKNVKNGVVIHYGFSRFFFANEHFKCSWIPFIE